jgi:hypothetical protein
MFSTLEFVMVACLFADLAWSKGAAFVAWAKGAEATVVSDVKKL